MNEDLELKLPDGRVLAYAEYGDPAGVPVVCLHGSPGTRHLFSLADASACGLGLRLIAPDRAGIGGSDDCPGQNIGGHVEDVEVLLDSLGERKFAVLGLSGGGPYAVEIIRRMPDRVSALALVSAYAPGVHTGPAQRSLLGLSRLSVSMLRWLSVMIACGAVAMPLFARVMMSLGANRADRQALRDRKIRQCLHKGMQGVLRSGRGTAREVRNFSLHRLPLEIKAVAPVRIWHGTEDNIVAPEAALCYARMFPEAFVNFIPGAGHYWGLVNHGEVLEALAGDLR